MDKNMVTLKKIPLQLFIDKLVEIYENGVDYIDLVGIPDEIQDEIGIVIKKEYYAPDESESDIEGSDISDCDLNDIA